MTLRKQLWHNNSNNNNNNASNNNNRNSLRRSQSSSDPMSSSLRNSFHSGSNSHNSGSNTNSKASRSDDHSESLSFTESTLSATGVGVGGPALTTQSYPPLNASLAPALKFAKQAEQALQQQHATVAAGSTTTTTTGLAPNQHAKDPQFQPNRRRPFASSHRSQQQQHDDDHDHDDNHLNHDGFTLNKLNFKQDPSSHDTKEGLLMGRDPEVQKLQSLLHECTLAPESPLDEAAPSLLVTIVGASGTGKTVLARRALQPAVLKAGGFFCAAKFDAPSKTKSAANTASASFKHQQWNTGGEPYATLAKAFRRLARQVASRPDVLERVIGEMQATDPHDAAVLLDIMPGLGLFFPHLQQQDDASSTRSAGPSGKRVPQSASTVTTVPTASTTTVTFATHPNAKQQAGPLQFLLRKLIRAITTATSSETTCATADSIDSIDKKVPLVLVLDDVQWADPQSLQLVQALLTDPTSCFFCVTTCRQSTNTSAASDGSAATKDSPKQQQQQQQRQEEEEQEQEQDGYLQMVARLKRHETVCVHPPIMLQNLSPHDTSLVVAHALRSTVELTQSLSDIVYVKTLGNPLVVVEFLKSLVAQGYLTFHFGLLDWMWEEGAIQSLTVSDNVADLLTAKMQRLPPAARLFLQVAACLGSEFEEEILFTALEHLMETDVLDYYSCDATDDTDFGLAAERCLADGLLDQYGSRFTFAHDQVQAAAFSLIPPESVVHMQLEIGRRLLDQTTTSVASGGSAPAVGVAGARHLFLAVDLYNCGASLLEHSSEKTRLAQFNLVAGERAIQKAAFSSAVRYLEAGLALCDGGSGGEASGELRRLRQLEQDQDFRPRNDHSHPDLEKKQERLHRVFGKTDVSIYDKVQAYRTRMVALGAQERYAEAIGTGLYILKEYNRHQPQNGAGTSSDYQAVVKELTHTSSLLRKLDVIQSDLAELSNEERLTAMTLVQKKAQSAFHACLLYLESCLKTLDHAQFHAASQLRLQLSIAASEATYCVGDFAKMERHMNNVMSSASGSFHDKVRMYRTRMVAFGAQERFDDAIATGLFILKQLDMVSNVSAHPSSVALLKELKHTQVVLKKYDHDSRAILQLPVLTDENRILAMGIIHKMAAFTFLSRPNLYLILYCKAVRWSVKYGVCQYSPPALAMYGMILCGMVGDYTAGAHIGDVALALSERLNARETLAATSMSVFGYILHWTKDLRASAKPLLYGYQVGMETGDVEIAVLNLHLHDQLLYHTAARKLTSLAPQMAKHVDLMREYRHDAMANLQALALQTVWNLMGQSENPLVLTGQAVHQEVLFDICQDTQNAVMAGTMESWLAHLAYLFDEYEASVDHAERTPGFGTKFHHGALQVPRHTFFKGLAYLAMAQQGKKVRKSLQHAAEVIKTMKKWTQAGNVNVRHCLSLLQAEWAWAKKKPDAAALYEEAINLAGRAGYLHDKALAHARAGRFHLHNNSDKKDRYWAVYHLDRALQGYSEWGAKGVAVHLGRMYQDILWAADAKELSDFSRAFLTRDVKGKRRLSMTRRSSLRASSTL